MYMYICFVYVIPPPLTLLTPLTQNKRTAYKSARDLESGWEQLKDMKSGKSVKQVTEKDVSESVSELANFYLLY